jgi:hypothetical protein
MQILVKQTQKNVNKMSCKKTRSELQISVVIKMALNMLNTSLTIVLFLV